VNFPISSPILLEVMPAVGVLRLRLDEDPSVTQPALADTIVIATFEGWDGSEAPLPLLHEHIGMACDIDEDAFPPMMKVYLNYQADEVDISCRAVHMSRRAPTIEEMHLRAQTVARVAEGLDRRADSMHARLQTLFHAVTGHLEKSLDRAQRKADFFRASKSQRAGVFEREVASLQEILRVVVSTYGSQR
jgi:hypothetical protein